MPLSRPAIPYGFPVEPEVKKIEHMSSGLDSTAGQLVNVYPAYPPLTVDGPSPPLFGSPPSMQTTMASS
jgi:hypothetical protein